MGNHGAFLLLLSIATGSQRRRTAAYGEPRALRRRLKRGYFDPRLKLALPSFNRQVMSEAPFRCRARADKTRAFAKPPRVVERGRR